MVDRLALYEATRARLRARIVELRAEQRRVNGFGVVAVVAAAVARFWGLTPMIVAGILGASLFFVGHYVVYMHIHESKLTLAQLRKSIDQLRPVG